MINLAVPQYYIDQCLNKQNQGMNLNTYIKDCFFIYEQDCDSGTFKIVDKSTQVSFYDPDTDVHQVFITILDDDDNIILSDQMEPFGTFNYKLPKEGCYIIEIDTRYTIQYDNNGEIIPHTFQNVKGYPACWDTCGDYFNNILYDIKCRISKLQCAINKRKCVGRGWSELQERVYALNNYLYALCNFSLSFEEVDIIACKIKTIKKAC